MSISFHPYPIDIPERLNMADWAIDRWVRQGRGDRVAFVTLDPGGGGDGALELTYAAMQERMNRAGNAMRALGVGRGERVLVRSQNTPEILAIVLGCLKIGAVPMAVSSLFRSEELAYILRNSEAAVAVSSQELAGPLRAIKPRLPTFRTLATLGGSEPGETALEPLLAASSAELEGADSHRNDAAFVFYTSGTSGNPKGICQAHRYVIGALDPLARFLVQFQPHERMYNPHEISFSYAFGWSFFMPLLVGASSILHLGRIEPRSLLENIQRFRPQILASVPTLYNAMMALDDRRAYDMRSLRLIISAGAPLHQELHAEMRAYFGCEVREAIGQSESQTFIGQWSDRPRKPGSLGYPLPSYHIRIIAEEGNDCPPGAIGSIAIRDDHPSLFIAYQGLPQLWQANHRDGWYHTGDMGHLDEEGCIWFDARGDDLIKSRGYLVSPDEIERVLAGHPAVAEVGVVGVPDAYYGRRLRAYVALRPGAAAGEEELKQHVRQRLAPFKTPQEVVFLPAMPRTATGKLQRLALRRLSEV